MASALVSDETSQLRPLVVSTLPTPSNIKEASVTLDMSQWVTDVMVSRLPQFWNMPEVLTRLAVFQALMPIVRCSLFWFLNMFFIDTVWVTSMLVPSNSTNSATMDSSMSLMPTDTVWPSAIGPPLKPR